MKTKRYITISILMIMIALLGTGSTSYGDSWDPEPVLVSFLQENFPWEEIQVSGILIRGELPESAPEMINVEKGPLGNAVFAMMFSDGRKLFAKANVQAFDKIVKSRRPFKKGHVMSADDLYLANMDIRRMPNGAYREIQPLIGKLLKRSIRANFPLVEGIVQQHQTIKRGKQVTLVIDYNGMSMTAAGKTKEKGYIGMPVKAVNISSRNEVEGILVDANTVRVDL
ncbi:MAG: flagellar basal body P-ring formation protein FlgA [Nitrospira sp.]|nr:flagellar basal body P-ring formation protein FlgA [Nitrospira sp.]